MVPQQGTWLRQLYNKATTLDPLIISWDGELSGILRLSQVRATLVVLENLNLETSFCVLTGSSKIFKLGLWTHVGATR
jgi:hypothetical protein